MIESLWWEYLLYLICWFREKTFQSQMTGWKIAIHTHTSFFLLYSVSLHFFVYVLAVCLIKLIAMVSHNQPLHYSTSTLFIGQHFQAFSHMMVSQKQKIKNLHTLTLIVNQLPSYCSGTLLLTLRVKFMVNNHCPTMYYIYLLIQCRIVARFTRIMII